MKTTCDSVNHGLSSLNVGAPPSAEKQCADWCLLACGACHRCQQRRPTAILFGPGLLLHTGGPLCSCRGGGRGDAPRHGYPRAPRTASLRSTSHEPPRLVQSPRRPHLCASPCLFLGPRARGASRIRAFRQDPPRHCRPSLPPPVPPESLSTPRGVVQLSRRLVDGRVGQFGVGQFYGLL